MRAEAVPDGNRESSSASICAGNGTGHGRRALNPQARPTAYCQIISSDHHAQLRCGLLALEAFVWRKFGM